jgi:hypothetical protein
MMKQINFSLMIMIMMIHIVDVAHIPLAGFLSHIIFIDLCIYPIGSFNPFADENQPEVNESHSIVNQPSHDYVHQSLENNETLLISNNTHLEKAGPSLDIIDSHPHNHDDENDNSSVIIEIAKRLIIQPSIDFLDAQLHGGEEHIHDAKNATDEVAANLNDFQRWLKEQNQTDQLNRFLLLQKEMNHFRLDDSSHLNDKLNRTIEEMKLVMKQKQPAKHEL